MKVTKLLPRLSLSITFALSVFAFLSQSTGSLLADGAVAPQSLRTGSVSATSPKITIAPLTKVAACLPQGSSCAKAGDCCSGNCDPQHGKCQR
jgi:hypothetical protein